MKHRGWLSIPLALALAGVAQAQDVDRCIEAGVAYGNMPCAGKPVDAGLLRLPGYADPPQRDGASAPSMEGAPASGAPVEAPMPGASGPAAPDTIAPGMSAEPALEVQDRVRRT